MEINARTILAGAMLICVASGCNDWSRKWFLYRNRHNPNCLNHEECFSKLRCSPPNGVFCHWRGDESYKGVCVCQEHGLRFEDVFKDAGFDDKEDGGSLSEEGDH